MHALHKLRKVVLITSFALLAGACGGEDVEDVTDAVEGASDQALATAEDLADEALATADEMATDTDDMTEDTGPTEEPAAEEPATSDQPAATDAATAADGRDSGTICGPEGIKKAIENGSEEGTLAGMADDPVGTAASNNPVLTTLTQAATAAGLVDTLNSAEALTVFAPTDCAFANMDPATMDAAMADPSGLLTTVLGYHVIPGERIASADLQGEYTTFTEEMLFSNGRAVARQGRIVVPDVETANATVHLIDTVLMPPSISGAAGAEPTETE